MPEEGAPEALSPRHVRARRRRRRRRLGALVFGLIAVAVLGATYLSATGGNDSSNVGRTVTTLLRATTTTVARPFGPYKVTTGVNVRQGAGTNFPSAGTISTGHTVFVACVLEGQPVAAPTGPESRWLRLSGFGPSGYVTALYVNTGDDLTNNKIPTCAGA
jgi:hypothetical protein